MTGVICSCLRVNKLMITIDMTENGINGEVKGHRNVTNHDIGIKGLYPPHYIVTDANL